MKPRIYKEPRKANELGREREGAPEKGKGKVPRREMSLYRYRYLGIGIGRGRSEGHVCCRCW